VVSQPWWSRPPDFYYTVGFDGQRDIAPTHGAIVEDEGCAPGCFVAWCLETGLHEWGHDGRVPGQDDSYLIEEALSKLDLRCSALHKMAGDI
jgi:hypothetical protein